MDRHHGVMTLTVSRTQTVDEFTPTQSPSVAVLLELERAAGAMDRYRQVSRLVYVIARRPAGSQASSDA
jgi:hypothetical protein